jgi:dolichyl-phosphate-mannose-protein mannosyltransferase
MMATRPVSAAAALAIPDTPSRSVPMTTAARPVVGRRVLVAVFGLALAAHVHTLLSRNINWDEFYFLSFVYDYARGTLATPLQSFHVHFFRWLTAVGGQEVDQVIVARGAMLLVFLGTCACVYRLARRTTSVDASWFAVICCAGYTNILQHGASFRTDGLSVCLLMAALVLVQSPRRRGPALAAGAMLVAVAVLITLKSVLFLPTICIVLAASPSQEWKIGRRASELAVFLIVLAAAALALYAWHLRTLAGAGNHGAVGAYLRGTASKVVVAHRAFLPGLFAFQQSVRGNLIQWSCIAWALWLIARDIAVRRRLLESCALLALTLPLLSLAFYRNAYPYFLAFLMPPALVLCAVTFDALAGRIDGGSLRDGHLTVLATMAIALGIVWYGVDTGPDGTLAQRQVIRAVHEMFPQPVPYIGRNGMVASFPRIGFFMSTWGLEDYRAGGTPVFTYLVRTYRPKFLIVNSKALEDAFDGNPGDLFDEDAAVLREHFVRVWGPLYVAGVHVRLEEGAGAEWNAIGGGSYRVYSAAPVTINGSAYAPGSVVVLPDGPSAIHSLVTQDVELRTSDAGPAPHDPPPAAPLYSGWGFTGPTPMLPR